MLRILIFLNIIFLISPTMWSQNESNSNNYLQWGKIKMPINELVNGSNGRIKLSLNEVLESSNEPIVLIKNGKDTRLKSFYFIITKNNLSSSPSFVHVKDYDKKDALNTHGKAFVKKHLQEGQSIYFNNIKSYDDENEEHFLSIEIEYNILPLKLNFSLPETPKKETFGFQILEFPNQQLRVKLDTADVANAKVFNTYKNLDKYEVVHIPNFKTNRRYLTEKNILKIESKAAINFFQNNKMGEIDLNLLSEFTDYNEFAIELKWGEMVTSDLRRSFSASGNDGVFMENSVGEIIRFEDYDKYDLQNALGKRFALSQGYKTYKIKRMKIYIIPKGEAPTLYETDDINHPELEKVFFKIEKNTMILFSDIVIEKNVNELLYFPTSLLFGIR